MKFGHISDSHLGSWRNVTLREINMEAFERAMDICKEEAVDFVLISGDLFDTSRPPIDILKRAVANFRDLREHGISLYVIQGSHDFSPTGKTFLHVLEEAGLLTIPVKGKREGDTLKLGLTTDEDTGAQIGGLPGKMGGLEEVYYQHLDRDSASRSAGFKIFMFHTGIKEMKPDLFEHMKAMPKSMLPSGFDYYAGGHIHKKLVHATKRNKTIVFPGPLFPTNYRELEEFKSGGFYLVKVEQGHVTLERKDLPLYDVVTLHIDADNRSAREVQRAIEDEIAQVEPTEKIILIRVEGTLSMGTPADIEFRSLRQRLEENGAKVVRFHKAKLSTKEFEEIATRATSVSQEELEDTLIREHAGQHQLAGMDEDQEITLTKELIEQLSREQQVEETNDEYRERIQSEILSALNIKDQWREYSEI